MRLTFLFYSDVKVAVQQLFYCQTKFDLFGKNRKNTRHSNKNLNMLHKLIMHPHLSHAFFLTTREYTALYIYRTIQTHHGIIYDFLYF